MANEKNRTNQKSNVSTRPKSQGATREVGAPLEREASPLSIAGIRGGTVNSILVKIIMFGLIAIFAVGFLFTAFTPDGGQSAPDPAARLTSTEVIARVGNDEIERGRFESIAARQEQMMAQFGQKVGPLEYLGSRQRTLQTLIDNAALVQAARDAGMTVTEDEIAAETKKRIEEQIKNEQGQDAANFRRQIEAQYGSLEAYRSELQQMAEGERDNIEKTLLTQKLEKKIKDENKVTEADYKKSQTKLKLRQITIRPQLAGFADKTKLDKNKADAKAKAEKLAAQIKKTPTPQNFASLAKAQSDDLMTKSKGGDLGWKLPAELPLAPEVRDAVVNATGKIVGPIADEAGGDQYIFLIESRALKLPKDYAKSNKKLLKDFETQRDNEAWQKYQGEVSKAAKSELLDPALQAYKIQTEELYKASGEEQNKLRQQALEMYQQALTNTSGTEAAAIGFQMAQLHRDLKQPKEAVAALKKATENSDDAPQLQLELARSLRETGDKKAALTELQKVSKELDETAKQPAPPSMFGGNPNDALRFQVAGEYEILGRKDLASKERGKVKPAAPGGMGMPGGGTMMPGGGTITIPPRR